MKYVFTIMLFFSATLIFIMNSCINRCGDDAKTYVADSAISELHKIKDYQYQIPETQITTQKVTSRDTLTFRYDSVAIVIKTFYNLAAKNQIFNEGSLYACSYDDNYQGLKNIEILANENYNDLYPKGKSLMGLLKNVIQIEDSLTNYWFPASCYAFAIPPKEKTLLHLEIYLTTPTNKKIKTILPPFYVK